MSFKKIAEDSTLQYIAHEFGALNKSMQVTWYGDSIADTEFQVVSLLDNSYRVISKYQSKIYPHIVKLYDEFAASFIPRIKYIAGTDRISRNNLPKFVREHADQFKPQHIDLILRITDNIVPNNNFMVHAASLIENAQKSAHQSFHLSNEYEKLIQSYQHIFKKAHTKIAIELKDKDAVIQLGNVEIDNLLEIEELWNQSASLIRYNFKEIKAAKSSMEALQSNQTLRQQDSMRIAWIKRSLERLSNLQKAVRDYIKNGGDEQAFFNTIKSVNHGLGCGFKNAERKIGGWVYDVVNYLPKPLREKYLPQVEFGHMQDTDGNSLSEVPILQENMDVRKESLPQLFQEQYDDEITNKNKSAIKDETEDVVELSDDDVVVDDETNAVSVPTQKDEKPAEEKPKGLFDRVKSWFKRSEDETVLENFVKTAEILAQIKE